MTEESDAQLVEHLFAPSHVYQIHAQREMLRRGLSDERYQDLLTAIRIKAVPYMAVWLPSTRLSN